MMLDLGDTAEQIADKTGFSKTTIRHRLNIAKLDQKELKKKTDEHGAFQLSLKDLYELEKIEDIKIRDRVLKEAHDSRDLVWRAKQAVIEETRQKNLKAFISLFEKAGIKPASKKAEEERWSEDVYKRQRLNPEQDFSFWINLQDTNFRGKSELQELYESMFAEELEQCENLTGYPIEW